MASFQAQIGWKRQRKRENKNCHSVPLRSYPSRNRKFQKIAKKFKNTIMASFSPKMGCKMPWKRENKNTIVALWHPFKPKQVGKGQEREKIKIMVPFHSYTTRNWKFQKNSKKIQKTKQCHYGFIWSQK